ncbi:MAG: metal-dependent hydrolase [Pseudonocardia sp.]|uniref:metal-dependent hydrolase n=1 Tax=unclassified Pseudonocardia TaxID=2619320 RepID=UPI001AD230D2|nr:MULTISPECIES: metal-dependent hydrolase [unclassified Pseudonocardia]MBN9108056.1 metal-dependent hydrolase [Pseudonocardia sp.]
MIRAQLPAYSSRTVRAQGRARWEVVGRKVLGVSHALSGAALGLGVAGFAAGWSGAPLDAGGVLTFAAVCAGAALLPDLDHPSSMATTRFSWASVVASRVVRPLSALVYRLTRTPRDTGRGAHRGLTHTALFAVGIGAAVNAASAAWGAPVLLGTLFVCIALAIKGLDAVVPGPPSLLVAAGLTYAVDTWMPGGVDGTAGWLGTAVTLGVLVHSVGDAVTESGAPLLWPVPIRRRRWYPVGGPRPMRMRTGGRVETLLVAPALALAVFLLVLLVVPGAGELALELRDRVGDLLAVRSGDG